MKGSHLFWLSRSKGMTVDISIRDYNPPRCFQGIIILQGVSSRKSLAGVNIMAKGMRSYLNDPKKLFKHSHPWK
jgi:hypothetical protein